MFNQRLNKLSFQIFAQTDKGHFKVLTVFLLDVLQYQAGKERLHRRYHNKAADDEGGETLHKACSEIVYQNRHEEQSGQKHQHKSQQGEKRKGLVCTEKADNGLYDLKTVGHGVELGLTAFGAVPVVDDDVFNAHILVHRVNAHLGLYLKALGQNREALYKLIGKSPVAGHNILDAAFEEGIDAKTDDPVSKIVEGTLILFKIGGGEPVAHHHIHLAIEYKIYHLGGVLGGIGIVSVCHEVALGVYLSEHTADHVALTLLILMTHHSSCGAGDVGGTVFGIVVININYTTFGQYTLEILHDFLYGGGLVVTGYQNSDLIHIIASVK